MTRMMLHVVSLNAPHIYIYMSYYTFFSTSLIPIVLLKARVTDYVKRVSLLDKQANMKNGCDGIES